MYLAGRRFRFSEKGPFCHGLLGYDNANIEVLSLPAGERKTLKRAGYSPRYFEAATGPAGSGRLVYLHRSTLFAVPFHPGRLTLAGSPVSALENVSGAMVAGADFAFAGNGTAVYLAGKLTLDLYPILWLDRGGKTAQPLHAPAGRYLTPRFSPDGKRLAFAMASGKGQDIWVKDLDRDTTSRLSFLPGENNLPVWTPDGKNIVFNSSNPAAPGLYGLRSDGSGEARRLTEGRHLPFSFSPDGKRIAIAQNGNGGSYDIFTLPVEADSGPGPGGIRLGKADLFLGTPFSEISPAFSPDGRWLAYQSDESGILDVYVRPFFTPGGATGGRWQVSTGGGRDARWSRDGRDLLFQGLDGRVMAAGYAANGDTFTVGKPRVWTETRVRHFGVYSTYDIEPNGRRLAAMAGDDIEATNLPASLTVLVNFGDELRRKAPAGE